MRSIPPTARLAATLAFAGLSGAAAAGSDPRVPLLPAYQQECGNCHVAFPPGLLGAGSWERLIANLPRHFGSDASLDTATTKQIAAWLSANAGSGKRVVAAPPEDRLTRSPWFTREHREVTLASWKLPAVKSPANCAACHAKAEQGDFNEHDIRVPR